MKIYIIKIGDTIDSIAEKLEVTTDELMEVNPQLKTSETKIPNRFRIGMPLIIPELKKSK